MTSSAYPGTSARLVAASVPSGSQRSTSSTKGLSTIGGRGENPPVLDLLPRQVRRAERHGDDERRAPPGLALGGDGAAVQLDELLHQGEADAAPLVRPPACVLDPVEPLE